MEHSINCSNQRPPPTPHRVKPSNGSTPPRPWRHDPCSKNFCAAPLGGGHGRGVERNGPARQGERANDPVRKEADAGVSHVDQGAALRHPPGSTPPEEPLRRWPGGGPQHPARSTSDPRLSASGGLRRRGPRMASSVSCHFGGQAPRWNLAAASTSAQR